MKLQFEPPPARCALLSLAAFAAGALAAPSCSLARINEEPSLSSQDLHAADSCCLQAIDGVLMACKDRKGRARVVTAGREHSEAEGAIKRGRPGEQGESGPDGLADFERGFIKIKESDIGDIPKFSDLTVVLNNKGGSSSHNNIQPFQAVNSIIALFGVYPSRNRRDLEEDTDNSNVGEDYQGCRRLSSDPFIGEITMFAGNFAPRGWAFWPVIAYFTK